MFKGKKKSKKKEEAPKPLIEKVEVQETKKDDGVRIITRSNG